MLLFAAASTEGEIRPGGGAGRGAGHAVVGRPRGGHRRRGGHAAARVQGQANCNTSEFTLRDLRAICSCTLTGFCPQCKIRRRDVMRFCAVTSSPRFNYDAGMMFGGVRAREAPLGGNP